MLSELSKGFQRYPAVSIGNGSERRRWARCSCDRILNWPWLWVVTNSESNTFIDAVLRDIGLGGCSFGMADAHTFPERFGMKILFPDDGGVLELEGCVAWTQLTEKGLIIGVAFPGLLNYEQRFLSMFFQQIASKSSPIFHQQVIAYLKRGSSCITSITSGNMFASDVSSKRVIQEHADLTDVTAIAHRYDQ